MDRSPSYASGEFLQVFLIDILLSPFQKQRRRKTTVQILLYLSQANYKKMVYSKAYLFGVVKRENSNSKRKTIRDKRLVSVDYIRISTFSLWNKFHCEIIRVETSKLEKQLAIDCQSQKASILRKFEDSIKINSVKWS